MKFLVKVHTKHEIGFNQKGSLNLKISIIGRASEIEFFFHRTKPKQKLTRQSLARENRIETAVFVSRPLPLPVLFGKQHFFTRQQLSFASSV